MLKLLIRVTRTSVCGDMSLVPALESKNKGQHITHCALPFRCDVQMAALPCVCSHRFSPLTKTLTTNRRIAYLV
jgi:hypothetical protein